MAQVVLSRKQRVIAHRGYCSLYPENTMAAIEAALPVSDLVEFDLLMTKDRQIVVFHDRSLSRVTNIAALAQHQARRRSACYDSRDFATCEDWWVEDFTFQELRELQVHQDNPLRPQTGQKFGISSFQEVLRRVMQLKRSSLTGNLCGFLVELKTKEEYRSNKEWDNMLVDKVLEVLRKCGLGTQQERRAKGFPIILQSFSHEALCYLSSKDHDFEVVHLFDKIEPISEQYLAAKAVRNQIGIGITQPHVLPAVKEFCEKRGWQKFYWTIRDDQQDRPFKAKDYRQVYYHLLRHGVTGLITEFPERCLLYVSEYLQDTHRSL